MKLKSIAWLNLSKNKTKSIKYYQIVLYKIKNLLPVRGILTTKLKFEKTAF